MGEILYFNHIDHPQIAEIVNKSKGIFDVRRVNSGQKYTLINSNDSLSELCYFIYEENATDYIVFDFINGINIYRGKKKVKTKLKISQGTINSSLSETIDKLGISPRVSIKLSEIYAWTIDFFKIQEGDAFKVYYENNYIESVWWLLQKLYKDGLIYKGYTIQPYSPAAGTGLSTHELNQPGCYKDVSDTSAIAQFKSKKNNFLTPEL